jgi:hypothetical protein
VSYAYIYRGTCLIRHTKGPGKCVGMYKISEYSGIILVNRNHKFLSDVIGCRITQMSDNSDVG